MHAHFVTPASRNGARTSHPSAIARIGLALALFGGLARAALLPPGNLLMNPGFEGGTMNWTVLPGGSAGALSYGTPNFPSASVATQIGGGFQMLRDISGNAVVEQVVGVGPIPLGTNVKASGFFGGSGPDQSRLVLRFRDAAGVELGRTDLDPITPSNRNFETVLAYREVVVTPPPGTINIAVQVEFGHVCCGAVLGAADELNLELVTTPVTPPPRPLNVELLSNRNFESGWTTGSPLTLIDPQGWFGNSGTTVLVKPYSDTDGNVPSTLVSCLVEGGLPGSSCMAGGAGNLLADSGGGGGIRQRIDVRGNTPSFATPGTVALRIGGILGGVGGDGDYATIGVRYLTAAKNFISGLTPLTVSTADRNSQTVVLARQAELAIPANTGYIDIDVTFGYFCCNAAQGLADNISAMLVAPTPPAPIPLGKNLVSNGNFEVGSLPGSPLELTNPRGWAGINGASVEVLSYGSSAVVPAQSLAMNNGLGGLVMGDAGGGGALRQTIDLSGSQALIDSGVLRVTASAWLGGVGADGDSAELRIQFVNAAGVQVGVGGLHILGPVTAADRQNVTTLMNRLDDFPIPALAARMIVTLQTNYFCCNNADSLADDVIVYAYDTTASSFPFCFGDGSATECPCSNHGAVGRGCANSVNAAGALLSLTGAPNPDTVTLTASGMPNNVACIFLQGSAPSASGAVFGDGIRCTDGTLIRLRSEINVAGTSTYPDGAEPTVSVRGQVLPGSGDVRYYQVYYRNPAALFCPPATFNITNGWAVTW